MYLHILVCVLSTPMIIQSQGYKRKRSFFFLIDIFNINITNCKILLKAFRLMLIVFKRTIKAGLEIE